MGSQLRRKHKISQKDGDNETQIDHSTRSENQPEKQTEQWILMKKNLDKIL